MSNVTALTPEFVTASMVIDDIAKVAEKIEHMYVVGLPADGSAPLIWIAGGNASGAAIAALILQDVALEAISGNLVPDMPSPTHGA